MMKSIIVSEEIWEKLSQIKLDKRYSNMNQVVKCLLDIASNSNDPVYANLKTFFSGNKAKKKGKREK